MQQTLDLVFPYPGYFGFESKCRLEVYEEPGQPAVVIATELDDNPGTSITHSAERLALKVYRFLEQPEAGMRWIEHYPERGAHLLLEESFHEVTFTPTLRGFVNPQWRGMTPEEVQALVGPGRQVDR